jgi:hypothetical protein
MFVLDCSNVHCKKRLVPRYKLLIEKHSVFCSNIVLSLSTDFIWVEDALRTFKGIAPPIGALEEVLSV